MPKFARFDPSASAPSPVLGWIDTDLFGDYPGVTEAELVPVTPAQWAGRMAGGFAVQSGALVAYTPPVAAPTASGALAALAARRYACETGGIAYTPENAAAASPVATDRASQAAVTGAFAIATAGKWIDGTPWKCRDGSFMPLRAHDVMTMAGFVAAHVFACFTLEARLATAIAADPATDITTGWPAILPPPGGGA